ncbi:HPP family protein [Roseomonas sp. HF4]|uniref:HPP family protein n=1 Tax=Roseomonas sp. HF4 TaxID=2562313 RepID=UPI0010C0F0B5|nr:HPP family protein [Roseomonas sp. HF4]
MKPPPPRLLVQVLGAAMALLLAHAALSFTEHPWLLPSLGGSCVILFGMPRSLMAQPRSFLGGHLVATVVGLMMRTAYDLAGGPLEIWLALAVGLALAAMAVTRTIHSPAGANPVVVFVEAARWEFLASPLLPGLAMLFLVAFAANNLPRPWGVGPWPRRIRWRRADEPDAQDDPAASADTRASSPRRRLRLRR